MEMRHVWLAVIAGGKGTRLFPISHEGCPKQFCDLTRSQKFVQATIRRFLDLGVQPEHVVVITTNENQARLAKEQVRSLGVLSQNIFKESESWGYPGVMVKAADTIHKLDYRAVIINTPSDQFVVEDEEFKNSIQESLNIAEKGDIAVVGVKITDLVTAKGCGHVVFNPSEKTKTGFRKMKDFIEKPEERLADRLMRNASSAVNTGINVWKASTLLNVINPDTIIAKRDTSRKEGQTWELTTDRFLKMFPNVYVTAGNFEWHDCGTLSAMYDVVKEKTPNHKNANIGGGTIDRTDCLKSLFYAAEGFKLHATGFYETAVIANVVEVNGQIHPIVAIVRLSESQRVKELAEDIKTARQILSVDFQIDARNNCIMRSNISGDTIYGFVGVENCIVSVHKNADGTFEVSASQQISSYLPREIRPTCFDRESME